MPRLHVNKVRTVCGASVESRPVTIGRSSHNDIVLPDRAVSRQHCVIEGDDNDGLRLRDLGSHYGTMVNGQPVKGEVALHGGDVIGVGPYEITVDGGPGGEPVFDDALALEDNDRDARQALLEGAAAAADESDLDTLVLPAHDALDALRGELAAAQARAEEAEQRAAALTAEASDDASDDARALLDTAEARARDESQRADILAQRLEEAEVRIAELETGRAGAEQQRDESHRQLETLRAEHDGRRSRLRALEEQLAESRADQERAAAARDEARNRLEELEAQLADASERGRQAEERVAGLQSERDEALRAGETVRTQLEAALSARSAEIDELRAAAQAADRDLAAARGKLEKTLASMAELTARLASLEAAHQQAGDALARADKALARIKSVRGELLEASHDISAHQHDVDTLEAMWLETDEVLEEAGETDPVHLLRRDTIARRLEEAHEARDQAIAHLQEIVGRLCEVETPVREGLVVRRRSRFTIGGLLRG